MQSYSSEHPRQGEAQWQSVLDQAPAVALICNADGRINFVNRPCEHVTQRASSRIVGRKAQEVFPQTFADHLITSACGALARSSPIQWQAQLPHPDGPRQYLCTAFPLRGTEPRSGSIALLAQEITTNFDIDAQIQQQNLARAAAAHLSEMCNLTLKAEHEEIRRQNAESALRDAVAHVETLSYSLSHDLRAPLRTICSFAQLLLQTEGKRLQTGSRDFLEGIIRSAARLDCLVGDVLACCHLRNEELKIDLVNVEELVTDIIRERPDFQKEGRRIHIIRPLLPMSGNRASLAQYISRMLQNTVDAASPKFPPRIDIWTQNLSDNVRLYVSGTGLAEKPAPPAGILQTIQNNSAKGSLHGTPSLTRVCTALDLMGGEAGFHSEHGAACFWIQLPKVRS